MTSWSGKRGMQVFCPKHSYPLAMPCHRLQLAVMNLAIGAGYGGVDGQRLGAWSDAGA